MTESHQYEQDESAVWKHHQLQRHFEDKGHWWTFAKRREVRRWFLTLTTGSILSLLQQQQQLLLLLLILPLPLPLPLLPLTPPATTTNTTSTKRLLYRLSSYVCELFYKGYNKMEVQPVSYNDA